VSKDLLVFPKTNRANHGDGSGHRTDRKRDELVAGSSYDVVVADDRIELWSRVSREESQARDGDQQRSSSDS
jgi:hypothetical protein